MYSNISKLWFVQWPAPNEWRGKRDIWPYISAAVGDIDITSVEIYRPQVEPQELYFSGHRYYLTMHTQVIVDNEVTFVTVKGNFYTFKKKRSSVTS